jgi:hypothetical protein
MIPVCGFDVLAAMSWITLIPLGSIKYCSCSVILSRACSLPPKINPKTWLNDPELEDDFRQDAYKKPTMMLTNNKLKTSFTFRLLTLEFIGGCFQVFWRGSRLDQTFSNILSRSSAGHESDYYYNHSDHQDNVDQTASDMK